MVSKALKLTFAALVYPLLQGCANAQLHSDCMQEDSIRIPFVFSKTTTTYNETCAIDQAAQQMVESDDIPMQAVGLDIMNNQHSAIDNSIAAVLNAKTTPMDCKVKSVEILEDGSRHITFGSCALVAP